MSFVSGILSFKSSCILPLLIGYIVVVCGVAFRQRAAPAFVSCLIFVAGFSIMFTLLGSYAGGLGSPLGSFLPLIRRIFGIFTLAVGVQWVCPLFRSDSADVAAAFLTGLSCAGFWIPCVGPSLGSALEKAAAPETRGYGAALLGMYCLGMGIPLIATGALAGSFVRLLRTSFLKRWGQILSGLALVTVGLLGLSR